MEIANKEVVIAELPLFSSLDQRARQVISQHSQLFEVEKGKVIYNEGDPPDAFYCIIIGRVVIEGRGPSGQVRVLEYLHHGKYFGIISILTGEPHSVTARALNDCLLLKISKDDFLAILKDVPQLAIDLSRTLSRRLKDKDVHHKTIFESTIITIISCYPNLGKTLYTLNLALGLQKETAKSVIVLEVLPSDKKPSLPERLHFSCPCILLSASFGSLESFIVKGTKGFDYISLGYDAQREISLKNFLAILTLLVNDYHYLLVDLPSVVDEFVLGAAGQSDEVHILASKDRQVLASTIELEQKLKERKGIQTARMKFILNEGVGSSSFEGGGEGVHFFATLPKIDGSICETEVLDFPDSPYAKAIRRISRTVGERLVGLALGVGAAYGFCHIGVLEVFEQENIPIDIISGSSIGALIASLWVTGRSAQEILRLTQELTQKKKMWGLVDLTFPSLGFIKGRRLYNFLKRYLGDKTFYDIRIPLKIVASDIHRKEARILEKGKLVDAIMASCSMPGVFRPFQLKDEMLFDGGVVSPLPTEVLFKLGVNKIIAVNVTPSGEDVLRTNQRLKGLVDNAKEKRDKIGFLRDFFSRRARNNILDIIFRSIELMQSEIVQQESSFADVVLHPDTQGLHWLEFHKASEFALRGKEEARRNIERIRKVIQQ